MVIILHLTHPIVWLVRHVCSDEAEFFFFAKEKCFLMLFQTCTKLSDVFVVTVIARISFCCYSLHSGCYGTHQGNLANHTIGWDKCKIITTNRCYHQRLCLEAWHIKSVSLKSVRSILLETRNSLISCVL